MTQFIYRQDVDIFSQGWESKDVEMEKGVYCHAETPFQCFKIAKVVILADSESNSNQRFFVIRTCVNPDTEDYETLHLHPTVGMRMRRV